MFWTLPIKAMRNLEISIIPCSVEIDLIGIPTVKNVMKINRGSKTRKFRGNKMEIVTECKKEMLNGNNQSSKPLSKITRIFVNTRKF